MYKQRMINRHYILTLSCTDTKGIVAAVSTFLTEQGGFILESAQFGDTSTGRFFLRIAFEADNSVCADAELRTRFSPIAQRFTMDWELYDTARRQRALILVSHASHCFHHLLHHTMTGTLPMDIAAVASNHTVLEPMAKLHSLPFYHLPVSAETKMEQEVALLKLITDVQADVVVLARYMQILSDGLCAKLRGRAINIHHSFLPGFKGANPYKQAYDRGVKIIGATAHYVTADLDEGPIIEQEVTRVTHHHSPQDLKLIGQDIESQVLSRALKYHLEHRVLLNGNKTVVFS